MDNSLHYLLLADQSLLQKQLFYNIKDTDLSLGQPKVLDYLSDNDGSSQKEIAAACHIEPASLTSILNGMEKKGLIVRKTKDGNRRSLYVFLTDKGKINQKRINYEFAKLESEALMNFTDEEKSELINYLNRIYKNLNELKENNR